MLFILWGFGHRHRKQEGVTELLGENVNNGLVQNHTHFSLDIHRDAHEQRQIETHFQDVIPVMSLCDRLKKQRERKRETIGENCHPVICG